MRAHRTRARARRRAYQLGMLAVGMTQYVPAKCMPPHGAAVLAYARRGYPMSMAIRLAGADPAIYQGVRW